jgi:hypothetical protein
LVNAPTDILGRHRSRLGAAGADWATGAGSDTTEDSRAGLRSGIAYQIGTVKWLVECDGIGQTSEEFAREGRT